MIVDDGVPSRGHRHNIFNPSWRVHGCYTGHHGTYNTMTVQEFTGGIYPLGAENPVDKVMNSFMQENVAFGPEDGAPDQHVGYSTSVRVKTEGNKITKTVTCTYNLKNGQKKVVTKALSKTVEF